MTVEESIKRKIAGYSLADRMEENAIGWGSLDPNKHQKEILELLEICLKKAQEKGIETRGRRVFEILEDLIKLI